MRPTSLNLHLFAFVERLFSVRVISILLSGLETLNDSIFHASIYLCRNIIDLVFPVLMFDDDILNIKISKIALSTYLLINHFK